jgi:PhzF family phenazine biosynthesis protein
MTVPIYQVDAFASGPLAGNPAVVCLLTHEQPDEWMQSLAAAREVSETAFLLPIKGGYQARFFSPLTEIPLCGHATLAAAHVAWERGLWPQDSPIVFHCADGVVTTSRRGGVIWLDFPREEIEPAPAPPGLQEALGAPLRCVGRTPRRHVLEADREETIRGVRPDFDALKRCCPDRGIVVTSASSDPCYDFVSRYFAPSFGVNEDPVCGTAHCCLGPFWQERHGRSEMVARQVSPRGGVVRVRIDSDRVHLGGTAVTVSASEVLSSAGG